VADEEYEGVAETRAIQTSEVVRQQNHAQLLHWGAYNLLKVTGDPTPRTMVEGYITLLPAISGKTPRQMEALLGLRANQLARGASIYRLGLVPAYDQFMPRGYTTLVDGLHLKAGQKQDAAGFRPGEGAYQVVLIKPVPATLIATLGPDEPFTPGLHPDVAKRYGR
jgi:hypothetical protein